MEKIRKEQLDEQHGSLDISSNFDGDQAHKEGE